jgi:ABC-type polysaccharide/polyol phosphate transport system ATPase subunit
MTEGIPEPAIRVEGLSKVFRIYNRPRHRLFEMLTLREREYHREIKALEDVSLQVEPGQCLGIIGANGAGKSTLLRILAGISRPTAGDVSIRGRVSALLELNTGFHPEFTGRENIRINAAILGLPQDEMNKSINEIIAFSELEEFIDLPVRTYSSGMYLRLGFAVATAVDPDILLVDEALAVGDEYFRGKCMSRMREFRKANKTIVIVSHDLSMIRSLCDWAIFLDEGRLAREGKPSEAIEAYLNQIYRAAAAEAGASKGQLPEGVIRRGPGDVEITAVRMLNAEGKPSTVFRTGESLTIEFDYLAHKACPEPLFGINIFRADGVLVVGTNQECTNYSSQVLRPGKDQGDHPMMIEEGHKGTARFIMEQNLLKEGSYELSVNIFQGKSGAHALVEELLGVMRFEILPGKFLDRGVFVHPGVWKID